MRKAPATTTTGPSPLPLPQTLSEPTVTDRREVKERGVISEILSRIHNSEFIIHNYDY